MVETVRIYAPGLALAAGIAVLAKLLDSGGFGAALIYALLLGMLARPLGETPAASPGTDFSGKHLLAVAVALLGARLTIGDVVAIGLGPALLVVAALAVTLVSGLYAARRLGLSSSLGILAGSGVVFCGASAAVAVASVLPKRPGLERDTALVIASVVALSAIAMIVYPVIAIFLGLEDARAGIFLGGSIHNVPQAVAAGMAVSETAGDTATLTKLFRVSLLAPFVLALAMFYGERKGARVAALELPWFVIAFALLVIASSFGLVPPALKDLLLAVSGWLMLIAVAAIGMKTSLEAMRTVGPRVLLLLIWNSLVLAGILLAALLLGLT